MATLELVTNSNETLSCNTDCGPMDSCNPDDDD